MAKRKRARKACIPCHQRKRKCDTVYPCGMCNTYGYNCRYTDDNTTGAMGGGVPIPPPAKRVSLDGESRLARRAATDRSPSRVHGARPPRRRRLDDEESHCRGRRRPRASSMSKSSDTPGHRRPWHSRTSWAWLSVPTALQRCGRSLTTLAFAPRRHPTLTAFWEISSRRKTLAFSRVRTSRYWAPSAT